MHLPKERPVWNQLPVGPSFEHTGLSTSIDDTYNSTEHLTRRNESISMMDQLRVDIWDLIYRTGPQTREQIAEALGADATMVATVVEHEWFEILDATVSIATENPQSPSQGLVQ